MRSEFHEQNPYLNRRFIAVEGPIGVGKTSLTRLLADRWKCEALFESFEDNPFLTTGFYEKQRDYAFNTEIFFLLSRVRQIRNLKPQTTTRVADYLFDKNAIFSKMNLSPEDWALYEPLYLEFARQIPPPDLVVYLTADTDTLAKRVYARDRHFERRMSRDYLDQLRVAYDRYFETFTRSQVLRLNAADFDFVNRSHDFSRIAAQIEDHLQGIRQLSFQGLSSPADRSLSISA